MYVVAVKSLYTNITNSEGIAVITKCITIFLALILTLNNSYSIAQIIYKLKGGKWGPSARHLMVIYSCQSLKQNAFTHL